MTEPLTILSSMAMGPILRGLAETCGERIGQAIEVRAMGGVEAARLVRAGDAADVIVLAGGVIAQLAGEGHLLAQGCRDLARSGIAVAVPAGASRPALDDGAGVRTAMLSARKVGYSTGPSGDYLMTLLERWGIGAEMRGRSIQAPPGVLVASLLASGEVDIGFQQMSELMGQPGIDIIGPLPPDVQHITVFSAGVAAASRAPERALRLVNELASVTGHAVIRKLGMEPA